jgi:hypothetical protein
MEEKLRDLAAKYQIPKDIIKEAIEKEKERVILQNRRMVPILVAMIERYSNSPDLSTKDDDERA